VVREAHRPALATRYESAGDAGEYVARQWGEKNLILLDLPGADDQDRAYASHFSGI
jgi:hypothetical protein